MSIFYLKVGQKWVFLGIGDGSLIVPSVTTRLNRRRVNFFVHNVITYHFVSQSNKYCPLRHELLSL